MAPVPSTPTATDALLERKKILDENALLIQDRDKYRAEYTLILSALSAIREQFTEVTKVDLPLEEVRAFAVAHFIERRQKFEEEASRSEVKSEAAKKELDGIKTQVQQTKDDLTMRKEDLGMIIENIAERRTVRDREEQAHTEKMSKATEALATVVKENERVTADMEAKQKEVEEKTVWILEEEKRLATKGRDLGIWEQRLREFAEEAHMALPETI